MKSWGQYYTNKLPRAKNSSPNRKKNQHFCTKNDVKYTPKLAAENGIETKAILEQPVEEVDFSVQMPLAANFLLNKDFPLFNSPSAVVKCVDKAVKR